MQINVNNISKFYDGKKILDQLNLSIVNVKVIGIIGESGCGKSTLLRQLAGIELPDGGCIFVNNQEITKNNLKEYQEKIGVVFQKHNLFPHLSIEDNILLILEKIRGIKKQQAKQRCDELLKDFHLTEQAKKTPNKVSGGQAQRASIARAIAGWPELVFLDEPTAALDPLLTKEVLDSIKILRDEGVDFVFVTHEMDFLRKFADYFVFMDTGKIVEHGLIKELEAPKTDKLKKFIKR